MDSHANVIWGARIQKDYEGKVRVLAIMTGVQSPHVVGKSGQKSAATEDDDYTGGRSQARKGKAASSIIDMIK